MNKETIAYCAGIFDGEGWIGIGDYNSLNIRIVNTNKSLIDFLTLQWGGNVYKRKKSSNQKHKQAYDFMLREREPVVKFIKAVYPYLICRRVATDEAIAKHRLLRKHSPRSVWM